LDLKDPRNWRARTSVHVVIGKAITSRSNASPEFRTQCLKYDVREVDTFILTHGHADHVLGMDDLRQFCTNQGRAAIPVYSTEVGLERIKAIFPYAIGKPQGFGLRLAGVEPDAFEADPARRRHHPLDAAAAWQRVDARSLFEEPSTGAKFAYYTDCRAMTEKSLDWASMPDLAILDGLRPNPAPDAHDRRPSLSGGARPARRSGR
jgi:phosphoribosyl 1,2-cyclic phosphate phosphodiesterase